MGELEYFRPKALDGLCNWLGLPRWLASLVLEGRQHQVVQGEPVKGLPVIIYTHGIGGCQEMYTQFCRELASCGAVVVAIEHEDGSASFAEDSDEQIICFKRPPPGTAYTRENVV